MLEIHKHKVSFHFTFLPVRNSTGKEAKYYTQQSTNFASLILSVANLPWANIFKDFWTDYNPFSLSTAPCLSFTHKAREVTHLFPQILLLFDRLALPKNWLHLVEQRINYKNIYTPDSSWVDNSQFPKVTTFGQRKPQLLHQSKLTHAVLSLCITPTPNSYCSSVLLLKISTKLGKNIFRKHLLLLQAEIKIKIVNSRQAPLYSRWR